MNRMTEEQMPEAPESQTVELSERGLTGSAAVVGLSPSDQFIPPTMNLDGPPQSSPVETPAAED